MKKNTFTLLKSIEAHDKKRPALLIRQSLKTELKYILGKRSYEKLKTFIFILL